jgi:thiol-disulfide isomerase/thioredoxin
MVTRSADVERSVIGLWLALAAIAVALAFGGYRALTNGRFRGTHAVRGLDPARESTEIAEEAPSAWAQLSDVAGATVPGERATLVQFSSAFCAPCRVARRVLGEVADVTPGVVHLEIDAELHLEAVRRLGILRTPTTLVLDAAGREIARAAGAPRKDQVLAVIPTADLA